jgi:hypothetical protein
MKASISTLHHQDIDWLRELDFYKGEIAILNKRLEEVITGNTDVSVTSQVEHFQNKCIVLKEVIETLGHDIRGREAAIERSAEKSPGHTNEHSVSTNNGLLSRMKNLALDVADSRFELNKFLSKTL